MNWISIKKQKPEIIIEDGRVTGCSEPVLTVDLGSDEDPEVQRYCKGGRGDLTTEYWSGFASNATHWMPIPKLPKK